MSETNAVSRVKLAWGGMAHGAQGLGPGRRTIVWVVGCDRDCPGCIAPELQERRGAEADVHDVADWITESPDWSGRLTISGGEPFDQAGALAVLIDELGRRGELEVLVYTGYSLAELEGMGDEVAGLLGRIDMLIDGPYRQELPNERRWRGSDNQRFHSLTSRTLTYRDEAAAPWTTQRPLGMQWIAGFGVRVVGIPRRGFRDALRDRITLLEQKYGFKGDRHFTVTSSPKEV